MPQILTLIILLKLWKKLCNETPCEGKIGLFLKINDHLINRKKKGDFHISLCKPSNTV